jgi:superfamily II DNA/RNA helicase
MKSEKLDSSELRVLVLDEADRLLDTGNQKVRRASVSRLTVRPLAQDIMTIFEALPKTRKVQVVICSATLHSPAIDKLAKDITKNATCARKRAARRLNRSRMVIGRCAQGWISRARTRCRRRWTTP